MKMWKYLFKGFIFLVILFLFWQTILILIKSKESFNGINGYLCQMNLLNQTSSSIPRLIHQMWKNEHFEEYPINNSHSEWKRLYPDYKIRLWTDKDLDELISRNEYKYLSEIYNSYIYSIQRADLGRLVILHAEGGIYADLDVFPCSSSSIEILRLSNVSLLIPRSTTGYSLINHFLIAQKSSHILDYILHQIVPVKFYQRIYILPYLEVFSTGSFFLTRVIKSYLQNFDNVKNFLWILSEDDVKNYVIHHTGRSWHLFDGFLLNQIDEKPKLTLFSFSLLLLCLLLIWKFRHLIDKFKINPSFSSF